MPQFTQFITDNQSLLRLGTFFLLIGLFLILERQWPKRVVVSQSVNRWFSNFGLLLLNIIAVRLLVPLATFEAALLAAENNWGLFNLLNLPLVINLLISIVVFDLLIYIQHVVFHQVPLFWRIHRVHHTDTEFDVTTGVRFHPFEIVLSLLYKLAAVFVFGPMALSIIIYEILLNAASLFTHSNVRLTKTSDALIRKVFVTPDMHRVHHSVIRQETDSNYGNIFSCWDKLFKTYRAQPEAGHEKMMIGLNEYRETSKIKLMNLLKLPFIKADSV